MKKVMEARVAQGLEKEQMGERFTLIDPARLPEKPVKPEQAGHHAHRHGAGVRGRHRIGVAAGVLWTRRSGAPVSWVPRSLRSPVLATIPEIVTWKDQTAAEDEAEEHGGGSGPGAGHWHSVVSFISSSWTWTCSGQGLCVNSADGISPKGVVVDMVEKILGKFRRRRPQEVSVIPHEGVDLDAFRDGTLGNMRKVPVAEDRANAGWVSPGILQVPVSAN